MRSLHWATLLLGCLVAAPALHAEAIRIDGDNPRSRITVTIVSASVDRVLRDFGETYGFEVKGLKNTRKVDAFSATMSGRLEDIMQRLLRNWNYMIIRSPDNKSGIKEVMILNSAYGSSAPKVREEQRRRKPSFLRKPKLAVGRKG
ncbi:MAG: hypothetical protein ACR2PO_04990 [Methyloligellaceae bacterium]